MKINVGKSHSGNSYSASGFEVNNSSSETKKPSNNNTVQNGLRSPQDLKLIQMSKLISNQSLLNLAPSSKRKLSAMIMPKLSPVQSQAT